MTLPPWSDTPDRTRDDGAVFRIGDRVKVVDQDIHGKIVRWDGGKAVVLDDDAADWMEEDDDGTLTYRLGDLVKWGIRIEHIRLDKAV
jgi:hypothetical protein